MSKNPALKILGPWLTGIIWLVAWTLPKTERDAAHENWK